MSPDPDSEQREHVQLERGGLGQLLEADGILAFARAARFTQKNGRGRCSVGDDVDVRGSFVPALSANASFICTLTGVHIAATTGSDQHKSTVFMRASAKERAQKPLELRIMDCGCNDADLACAARQTCPSGVAAVPCPSQSKEPTLLVLLAIPFLPRITARPI